jgi:taurine dioxygenase
VSIKLTKLSDALGATVTDDGDNTTLDQLCDLYPSGLIDALNTHHLLLFRGYEITPESQMKVCALFGPLLREVISGSYLREITSRRGKGGSGRLLFHSDLSFTDTPIAGISLYAVEVPDGGTSTVYANATMALETLASPVRENIGTYSASHVHEITKVTTDVPARYNDPGPDEPRASHPVVFTDPLNGKNVLYVSELMTESIDGLPRDESTAVLDELTNHVYQPSHIYEHHWQVHDLLVWDNIALQHARSNKELTGPRTLRRVAFSIPDWLAPAESWRREMELAGYGFE